MSEQTPDLAVNFMPRDDDRQIRRQTYTVAAVFCLIVAGVAALGARASYRAVSHGTTVMEEIANIQPIAEIRSLVFGAVTHNDPLTGDRLNILILGIGGEGHEGAELTDTMLIASIDIKNKRVALVSIPRDLAYPLGGGIFEKINALNAYAEQEAPGEGARRTKEQLEKLFDTRIHHVVRVDFRGFSSLVDAIGGVDVDVERSFTDPLFPTLDDKWMTISFKKGPQHMDGQTALTFSRSRHGNNGEGTDFARSHRQQLLLAAMREKLLSLGTLSRPETLASLYTAVTTHIQTDLSPWDVIKLAPLLGDFSRDRITMRVLSDDPNGELQSATVGGAFMLFPRKPDWSELRAIVQEPFTENVVTSAPVRQTVPVKIEIKSGTMRTGFASQAAAKLEQMGYEILAFGNAVQRGYERTTIYDMTGGKKPQELGKLRQTLQATVSVQNPSSTRITLIDGLKPERPVSSDTDFLVVLGEASYGFIQK